MYRCVASNFRIIFNFLPVAYSTFVHWRNILLRGRYFDIHDFLKLEEVKWKRWDQMPLDDLTEFCKATPASSVCQIFYVLSIPNDLVFSTVLFLDSKGLRVNSCRFLFLFFLVDHRIFMFYRELLSFSINLFQLYWIASCFWYEKLVIMQN